MSWNPLLSCLLALAGAQAIAWGLARGLGRRLPGPVVALGLALPLAVLSPFLFGHDLLVPTGTLDRVLPIARADAAHSTHLMMSDSTYQFLPWELEVRHALKAGRLPLWSDRLAGGSSPWSNPQAAVLSPIAMLARVAPIQHFLLVALALKILLAFEGTWLLARRLGASRVAAVLAGASFAVGGGVLSWSLFPHSATVAWVPWMTLGCVQLLRRPRARTIATTAIVTASLLLAGHPETALAGGLFAAFCGIGLSRASHRLFARGFAAAALAAVLGCGLAAPQVLPFLRAIPGSQRARDMLHGSMAPHAFTALSPASWFLPTTLAYLRAPLSPVAFGWPYRDPFDGPFDWVDALSGYAGLAAFGGAVVALLVRRGPRRDRRAWPFLFFAVSALLLVAGFLPLAHLVDAVPVLRVPVYPRLLPVVCLALAVAGAFGCDLMLRSAGRSTPGGTGSAGIPASRRRWQVVGALAAAAAVGIAVHPAPGVVALWLLLLCAPLAAARRRAWGAALLLAALALDLGSWSQRLLPHGQTALFYPPNPLTTRLVEETAGGAWRTLGTDLLVYPSLLPVYGLAEVRPNDPLAPSDYLRVLRLAFGFDPTAANYYASMRTVDHPLLSFLNVRAVVGNPYNRPRGLQALPVPGAEPFLLYRNPAALPRWFVPSGMDVIEPEGLAAWIARLADPGRVALYRAELAATGGFAGRAGDLGVGGGFAGRAGDLGAGGGFAGHAGDLGVGGEFAGRAGDLGVGSGSPLPGGPAAAATVQGARLLATTPGHVELEVPGHGNRLLATSLPSPGGWQVTAQDAAPTPPDGATPRPRAAASRGQALAKLTVDGAFLGALIPANTVRVDLDFTPPGLRLGWILCALACAGLLALAWSARGSSRQ